MSRPRPEIDRGIILQLLHGVHGIDEPGESRYLNLHICRYLETLNLLPQSTKQLKVLDLGVASGQLAILVRKLFGYQVFGVDFHDGWKERLTREQISLRVCDLASDPIPFGDEAFDIVLFCETLEHLSVRLHKVLQEARRILKPEGFMILTTPNVARLDNRLKLLLGRSPFGDARVDSHIHEYTANEIESGLLANGFQIERFYISNCLERSYSYHKPLHFTYRLLVSSIPSFRGCIIALARKPSTGIPEETT